MALSRDPESQQLDATVQAPMRVSGVSPHLGLLPSQHSTAPPSVDPSPASSPWVPLSSVNMGMLRPITIGTAAVQKAPAAPAPATYAGTPPMHGSTYPNTTLASEQQAFKPLSRSLTALRDYLRLSNLRDTLDLVARSSPSAPPVLSEEEWLRTHNAVLANDSRLATEAEPDQPETVGTSAPFLVRAPAGEAIPPEVLNAAAAAARGRTDAGQDLEGIVVVLQPTEGAG